MKFSMSKDRLSKFKGNPANGKGLVGIFSLALIFTILAAFLFTQWSASHIHLAQQHVHDDILHGHPAIQHAHNLLEKKINSSGIHHDQDTGSWVVEVDERFRLQVKRTSANPPLFLFGSVPIVVSNYLIYCGNYFPSYAVPSQSTLLSCYSERGPPLFSLS